MKKRTLNTKDMVNLSETSQVMQNSMTQCLNVDSLKLS